MTASDVSLREVLRYAYSGLAVLVAANFCAAGKVVDDAAKLGPVLTPIVAFIGGIAVYAFYRSTLGLVVDVLAVWCRTHWPSNYLAKRGVSRWNSLNAYRLIRSELFKGEIRKYFHIQHSEITTIFVTSFVAMATAVFLLATNLCCAQCGRHGFAIMLLAVGGGISFLLGMVADFVISRQECIYVRQLDTTEIRNLLVKTRLLLDSKKWDDIEQAEELANQNR